MRASAETFLTALSRLPNINSYGCEVKLTTLNAEGVLETELNLIETYIYLITIRNYRPETDPPNISIENVTASANIPKAGTVQRLSMHSAPIEGTYKILVDGVPLIKFNNSPDF